MDCNKTIDKCECEIYPIKSQETVRKGIQQIIINHINAGNLELNGICVNDLVKDIMSI